MTDRSTPSSLPDARPPAIDKRSPAQATRTGARPSAPRRARTAPARPPETIYEALRQAHDLQRQLCLRLVRLGARKPQARLEVFRALKTELAAHAAAEERFLYVPMLMSDAGLDASRHALSEHHDIDELVEDLERLAPDGEAWQAQAKALAQKVRHHLKEEESRFFQVSGKILTERQKRSAATLYRRDHDRMLRCLAAA